MKLKIGFQTELRIENNLVKITNMNISLTIKFKRPRAKYLRKKISGTVKV